MGYIVSLGQQPNTYTGFRAATADMETNAGELFVESLEGWSQEVPTPTPTPQQKRQQLVEMFSQLPLETRAMFADIASKVYTALDMGDTLLAIYFVQQAGQDPNANQELIAQMLEVLAA